ncbi:cohesin domain-containing protein [Desulfonema ishimotonii]|uniref:cohesin domain-containing protein n=1 Tax=Desulfonema ishimotonii TaxID=45657 RepID=UPI001407748D|nr:cohesin domain-containing protein [Desulfonema ishimotonii]
MILLYSVAWGTTISIPDMAVGAGEKAEVPVMIDAVDNLAGVRLTVVYDTGLLTFRGADKTRETTSLMHIVNSKKPGRLIIVMAGAKGIKGKKFPLLLLHFEARKDVTEKRTTRPEIKECQMMSDQLKDIQAAVSTGRITITPSAGEKPVPEAGKEKPAAIPSPESARN